MTVWLHFINCIHTDYGEVKIVPHHKMSNVGRHAFNITAHLFGILWQIICVIRSLNSTVLGIS